MPSVFLEALRTGVPPSHLDGAERIGNDGFPLLNDSPLKGEHQFWTAATGKLSKGFLSASEVLAQPRFRKLLDGGKEERSLAALALMERAFSYIIQTSRPKVELCHTNAFFLLTTTPDLLREFVSAGIDGETVLPYLLPFLAIPDGLWFDGKLIRETLDLIKTTYVDEIPTEVQRTLMDLRAVVVTDQLESRKQTRLLLDLDQLLGRVQQLDLLPGDRWVEILELLVADLAQAKRQQCVDWLFHLSSLSSSRPSERWSRQAQLLAANLGAESVRNCLLAVLRAVDEQPARRLSTEAEGAQSRRKIQSVNSDVLAGMCWSAIDFPDAEMIRGLSQVALSGYRIIPGAGARAARVSNAAITVLGQMGTLDAVTQLCLLKSRVRQPSARKQIDKALALSAKQIGVDVREIEELAVPRYGMTDSGRSEVLLDGYRAEVRIEGSSASLSWYKPDGRPQKTVPASVKRDHADTLKELQSSVREIDKMLTAQSSRIEQLYLKRRTWKFADWRTRYLQHPLISTLARRLIWNVQHRRVRTAGLSVEEGLIDVHGQMIQLTEEAVISLWHPLDEETRQVLAWRDALEARGIQQPFKQAHREIYLLTDAELRTATYSNRFAAHILRQHQFHALCQARGWKDALRLLVDSSTAAPHLLLPEWNLRAEFWVEGVARDLEADLAHSQAYLYIATDQVRFYPITSPPSLAHTLGGGYGGVADREQRYQNRPLHEIPAIVFSEVMRDVDLFVGVASVGNDPNWSDGGPQGRFLDYWQRYSFGELGATAQTRKQVLEKIVPRLKIASRCEFQDRYLVVRGDLRIYKIHLGSGNILMEPNDQYLCIVRGPGGGTDSVFLPFEGDTQLSLILSKALLLADDRKITDPTITRQIMA